MEINSINDILQIATDRGASDIHLVVNKHPIFRIEGDLIHSDLPILTQDFLEKIMFSMIDESQKELFLKNKELDFSYSCMESYQFRVNFQYTRGTVAATIRVTPMKLKSLEELSLPETINELTRKRKGLVIIAGTAGCGKSTTLTYMINLINQERKCKIITLEDPIEYIHESKQSLVVQREVGADTESFATALKYALRQDPDVVVVGEMRDLESISMALTTAETGHLVLSTVHAPDAIETINRIIDAYPLGHRDQISIQLAGNLLGVVAQMLVPSTNGQRVLATEVLVTNVAVQNLIRRGELVEIRSQLESEDNPEMNSFEQCLSEYVIDGTITKKIARDYSKYSHMLKFYDPKDFKNLPGREEEDEPKEKSENSILEHAERVLIIDEKEEDRIAMAAAIRKTGFKNISFSSAGLEASQDIMAIKPQVVVLDINIHNVDGFELCKIIKNHAALPNCIVILITGHLRQTDSNNARTAGADDFVIKTADFRLLEKSFNKIFNPTIEE